jgi:hypothetical protein
MRLASEIRAAKAPLKIPQLFLLPKLFKLRAPALFLRAEFGSESRAEILRLEHLPDFNLPFAAARAFLVTTETMAQRLVHAKRKIL